MKGERNMRREIVFEIGCTEWDFIQDLCVAGECSCLREARERLEKRIEAERAKIDERVERLAQERSYQADRLVKRYAPIEEMLNDSGFRSSEEIAQAVGIVLKSGVANTLHGLGELSKRLSRMSEEIAGALPSVIAPVEKS